MIKAWLKAKPKGKGYPFVNLYWSDSVGRWVDRYDATTYHTGEQDAPSETLPDGQHWDLIYT